MRKSNSKQLLTLDYFDFCKPLKELLETGRIRGADGETVEAHSYSTLNNLYALRETVLAQKPLQTLEIGLAHGGSAMCICSSLLEANGETGWHHTAIDPFQDSSAWGGCGRTAAEAVAPAGAFTHVAEYSKTALPRFVAEGRRFGLIYVDGSHLFEDVFIDAYFGFELLENGGVIFFDDCRDPHVDKVIRFIDANYTEIAKPVQPPSPKKPVHKALANIIGIAQLKAFRKVGDLPRPWDAPFTPF